MSWDWKNVHKRLSTWLAALSLSATGALGAYAMFPERLQGLVPGWVLGVLGAIAMGSAFLIPLATSYKQKGLQTGGDA